MLREINRQHGFGSLAICIFVVYISPKSFLFCSFVYFCILGDSQIVERR